MKLFSGIFKLSRKLNSAKLKTFDNCEVPVQPQQLLFDLAVALGGGCMHSQSVSKDKSVFTVRKERLEKKYSVRHQQC